jgi:hypothetical protein
VEVRVEESKSRKSRRMKNRKSRKWKIGRLETLRVEKEYEKRGKSKINITKL